MYLTADEYATITGRDEEEASTQRLKTSCMLLDARIGAYTTNEDGWKIDDVEELPVNQKDAVQRWVAQMVKYLFENDDQPPSTASVTLGKFSVSKQTSRGAGMSVPDELGYEDSFLVSSGIVKRGINVL